MAKSSKPSVSDRQARMRALLNGPSPMIDLDPVVSLPAAKPAPAKPAKVSKPRPVAVREPGSDDDLGERVAPPASRAYAEAVATYAPSPVESETLEPVIDPEEVEELGHLGISIPAERLNLAIHNGIITMQNPATGNHRTFRVYTVKDGKFAGSRMVALLEGPDNGNDYRPFAFVSDGSYRSCPAGTVNVWKRYRSNEGPASSWEVFGKMLTNPVAWEAKGVRFRISGKCRKCNRPLTHPRSIDTGVGPICETM